MYTNILKRKKIFSSSQSIAVRGGHFLLIFLLVFFQENEKELEETEEFKDARSVLASIKLEV